MTQQQILSEVANSEWQPEFSFTDDLDAVVDSILKPHEDYFLGLHSKVKGIIQREILFRDSDETRNVTIRFADVCNWQKELFDHKKQKARDIQNDSNIYSTDLNLWNRAHTLPNLHINLGLRKTNVKVGNWNPPAPMFLEDLKEMCFPISIDTINHRVYCVGTKGTDKDYEVSVINSLNYWYKTFQTIHFFEDLNGRVGGIVINILSFILTGKYLIKKKYEQI